MTDFTPVTVGTSPEGDEIKRFGDSGLNETIDKVMSGVTPGKHLQVVAFEDDGVGRFAAVFKMNNDWSAMGVMAHTWKTGENHYQAAIRWSPF